MTNFNFPTAVLKVKVSTPAAGQKARPFSSKLEGLLWEREVEEKVFEVIGRKGGKFIGRGIWWSYLSVSKTGKQEWKKCQTDLVFELPLRGRTAIDTVSPPSAATATIFILECKLSYHPYCRTQLLSLYLPVLRAYFGHAEGLIAAKDWQDSKDSEDSAAEGYADAALEDSKESKGWEGVGWIRRVGRLD